MKEFSSLSILALKSWYPTRLAKYSKSKYSLLSLVLLFTLSLSLISNHSLAKEEESYGKRFIHLYIGIPHTEVLSHLPPGAEFLGDFRKVVEGKLDRETKTLQLKPLKPGIGTLSIHDRKGNKIFEYRMDVRKSELTRVVREVRGLLHEVEGIKVKIVNNKVIIDGQVLMPRDLNRIYGVIKQYGDQVDSLVEVSPRAQNRIAKIIEDDINNPDIEVHAINGKFILKGVANSEGEKATAEIIAKTYIPAPVINEAEARGVIKKRKEQVVINLISVRSRGPQPPDKIIQLVVHYVEMSKKYLRSSAFRWAPSIQDNSSVGFTRDSTTNNDGVIAEISGIISGLLPKLNTAKSHGFARILESTSVTTKNRKPGLVQSSTRVPFLVQQGNLGGSTTEFADVGIKSEITPTIVNPRSDIIELKMKFEVSSLVGNTDRGPQTASNIVNTVVDVRSGQSAAVGGLISNTSGTEYNPESNPDAIFNLSASKAFRRNKSQFVIFVTPIIKSSASAGSEKIKRRFRLRE